MTGNDIKQPLAVLWHVDGKQPEKSITQTGVAGSITHTYLTGHKRKINNNRGYNNNERTVTTIDN